MQNRIAPMEAIKNRKDTLLYKKMLRTRKD